MTYAEFTVGQANLEAALRDIGAQLCVYPRNRYGVTKDAAKDENWYALKKAQATLLATYRALNGKYCSRFADEIRADRDARRAAILAIRAA